MDSKEMAPGDIERRSFEIITEELGGRTFLPLEEPVVKRVIHTTADFSYADSLVFTHDAAHCALDALRAGATVLTDTNMALAGISKPALAKLGCKAVCYMADPNVAAAARAAGTTRAELPGIEVHAGRLDEADMERELSGARIVVDATHPFATLASGNIRAASLAVGVRCLRLARAAEALPKGVVSVASIACAARFLSENPGRALLTTGSKELAPYTRVADFAERFFVRVLPLPGAITKCIDAGFSPSHVIGMQGPFTRELNEAMLRQVGAQWLVTKDSGTVGGTAEKIASARDVGVRCIVVARPAEGGGALSLREVEDALLREFAR